MTKLTPFLLFDGNCAEAMRFYQSCLGGELLVTELGDTPMGASASPEQRHKVVYAQLRHGAVEIAATDWLHETRRPKQGNTVAMYLTATAPRELAPIFDRLSVGADEDLLDALTAMPFGVYGHLADKYGVHWFFRGEPSRDGNNERA